MPPNKAPPGHRSHANQRALKAPRKRRPSLAEPRRCPLCHNTPEGPVSSTRHRTKGVVDANQALQRTGGQWRFAARRASRRSWKRTPPQLSVSVRPLASGGNA